jgi:hypothetical protein
MEQMPKPTRQEVTMYSDIIATEAMFAAIGIVAVVILATAGLLFIMDLAIKGWINGRR